jgi:predicted Rossmann fold nucleotide-binding protein DprA/Smf involved in DNA uptake
MSIKDLMLSLCLVTGTSPDAVSPFTLTEWLEMKAALVAHSVSAEQCFSFSKSALSSHLGLSTSLADRVYALLHRDVDLYFALSHYQAQGITLLTYEDALFPLSLKEKLGASCPPVLCAKGDLTLLREQGIGVLSSRLLTEKDKAFAMHTLPKIIAHHSVIVLGGVSGIMAEMREAAVTAGGKTVVFMANSLSQTPEHPTPRLTCPQGGLVLSLPPYQKEGFEERAILRNLSVMAFSKATLIIKAEDGKGSTFLAAKQAQKEKIAPLLCHRVGAHMGNQRLIFHGAHPITSDWDGMVSDRACFS